MRDMDVEPFNAFLKEQAKIIREQSFSREQLSHVRESVLQCVRIWPEKERNDNGEVPSSIPEALFELNLSMEIAYSNYRKENKNMWSAVFGWGAGKVKPIEMSDLLKK